MMFSLEACTFIPMPSGKPTPKENYDNKHYTNFKRKNYIEEEKDEIEIDFLKDVFPDGILIDQYGNKYWLTDFYDSVETYQIKYHFVNDDTSMYLNVSDNSSEESSFKVKIERKFFEDVVSAIDFRLINTKTNTRSNTMRLGYFGFRQNAADFLYINSMDDISHVKDNSIVILNTDIDYDEYFKDKEEKGYLFPEFHRGVFLNPFDHVIKNLTYDPKSDANAFLFPHLDNTILDSLRLENVNFTTDSKDCKAFSAITKASMNSVFSNIVGTKINFTGNCENGMSFISNISYNCDFLNSTIEGKITNNYKDENLLGYAGGLSSISFLYQNTFNDDYPYNYTEKKLNEIFTKYRALFSVIRHNTINADITATDFARGIAAFTDYNDETSIGSNEINGKLSPAPYFKNSTGSYYLDLARSWVTWKN